MLYLLITFSTLLVITSSKPSWEFKNDIKYLESSIEGLQLQTDIPIDDISRKYQNTQDDSTITHTLKFQTFGQDYSIPLVPVKPIFSSDFKMVSITQDDINGDAVPIDENSAQPELSGLFFVADDGPTSVYIENNENGDQLLVEGIIDDSLRIWRQNGILKAMKVRREDSPHSFLHDQAFAMRQNISTAFDEDFTVVPQTKVPGLVTVEVMPVLDPLMIQTFETNGISQKKYLGIFWNSVQRRYKQAKNPKIQFSISSAISIKKDVGFIKNAKYSPTTSDGEKYVHGFGKWLRSKKSKLPHFDVAMMHTGLTLGSMEDGKFSPSILGIAFTAGLCRYDDEIFVSCGISRDPGCLYTGMLTATHEMAHILGTDHDGSETAQSCAGDDDYIMSPSGTGDLHSWWFSECSLKNIQKNLRKSQSSCVRDKPISNIPMVNQYPSTTNLDKICKATHGPTSSVVTNEHSKSICVSIPCTTQFGFFQWGEGAPEGTPCDYGKGICVEGKCVKDEKT